MKVREVPYQIVDDWLIRTPLYSVSVFRNVSDQGRVDQKIFSEMCRDKMVQEAIYLASPSLFYQLQKWLTGESLDVRKQERLFRGVLKYLIRMTTRSTPFGLFAGCAMGRFAEETNIVLASREEFRRQTRPDMHFLAAFVSALESSQKVQKKLTFFPNNSLYRVGNTWRYVEYQLKGAYRQHSIVSAENSEYLEAIHALCKKGADWGQIINCLIDMEVEKEEAEEFLEELIEAQFLVSEWEPAITRPEYFGSLMEGMEKVSPESYLVLKELQNTTDQLDEKLGNEIEIYQQLNSRLKEENTSFQEAYLFQTDLEINCQHSRLDSNIKGQLLKSFHALNRLTPRKPYAALDAFKAAFVERYDRQEVPLSIALDVELGIGYAQNSGGGDIHPLVDDLLINLQSTRPEKQASDIDKLLHRKLRETLDGGKIVMELKDRDWKEQPSSWNDLPDTMYSLVKMSQTSEGIQPLMRAVSGSGAANLISRFGELNEPIYQHAKHLVELEESTREDVIFAEVVHLPESRVGNILLRPRLRKFEIPYLGASSLPESQQILLEDLWVSVTSGGRIVLRSKSHNKEVIPCLTSAHNYSVNALPVYQFLCDSHKQNKQTVVGFKWGDYEKAYDFLPRVMYGGVILSLAYWRIKWSEIAPFSNTSESDEQRLQRIKEWRSARNIPEVVVMKERDNELPIRLSNLDCVDLFISEVKGQEEFTVTEFLFDQKSPVKGEDGEMCNEFLFAFCRK